MSYDNESKSISDKKDNESDNKNSRAPQQSANIDKSIEKINDALSEKDKRTLALQHFNYNNCVDANIVSKRFNKTYPFQPYDYNLDETMSTILNTGGDYVNGQGSLLLLDVIITQPAGITVSWASVEPSPFPNGAAFALYTRGTACNLFKFIRIRHKSGKVIEFTDNLNALIQAKLPYCNFLYDGFSETFGGGSRSNGTFVLLGPTASPYIQSFAFPLYLLSGLFATNKPIPSQIMSELKIEIGLTSKQEAFFAPNSNFDVKISNARIVLDSMNISGPNKRDIMEKSVKEEGIQFPFRTYFNDNNIFLSDFTFTLKQSFSKCSQVIAIARDNNHIHTQNQDSMCSSNLISWDNVQWRLGSLYIPSEPIRCAEVNGIAGAVSPYQYMTTQQAFDNSQFIGSEYEQNSDGIMIRRLCKGGPLMSYGTFSGKPKVTSDNVDFSSVVIAQNLEKSLVLGLSGETINNSRMLSLSAKLINKDAQDNPLNATISIWVQHEAIVNIVKDEMYLDL